MSPDTLGVIKFKDAYWLEPGGGSGPLTKATIYDYAYFEYQRNGSFIYESVFVPLTELTEEQLVEVAAARLAGRVHRRVL